MTYSDYEQRLLDEQSGAELDRQAARREAKRYGTLVAPPDVPNLSERTFYWRTNALISWLNAS